MSCRTWVMRRCFKPERCFEPSRPLMNTESSTSSAYRIKIQIPQAVQSATKMGTIDHSRISLVFNGDGTSSSKLLFLINRIP